MTVSRQRHYLTVSFLSGIIIALLLFVILIKVNTNIETEALNPDTDDSTKPFLQTEEMVFVPSEEASTTRTITVERVMFEYVEVTESCGPHYDGDCLLVRSGPGTDYSPVARLRTGVVLKIDGRVTREDGTKWYKVVFDEWLRYPERITDDWYIAANFVEVLYDEGDLTVWENEYDIPLLKKIVIDKSGQRLYAYEDDIIFMDIPISTGLELTPTPNGTFSVFKKTPSRYMQGPIPGLADQQEYDLPGVPWNLYFTHGGAVIHGAFWHNSFGSPYSHGCVNLSPVDAKKLYYWADLGTKIIVQD